MKRTTLGVLVLLIAGLASNANAAGNNWMNGMNGNQSVAQFSIPGTHDSGALSEPVSGTAKCQNLSITDQLNAGVRFLDIRCRHINDAFAIHHGQVYENANFDDVLNAAFTFLNANPSETVIMSVKEEYTASGDTRTFEQTFDSYVAKNPSQWYLGSGIPTLSQARGKIVLFRRFGASSTPKGIDASNWPDNTTFTTSNTLRVQDNYNVSSNTTKWSQVLQVLNEAYYGAPNMLYVNFASGVNSSFLGIPNIPTVSNAINPNLTSFFASNTGGRYGVVMMDFVSASMCSMVYNTNAALNYSVVASENQTVNFSTPVDAAYGANSSFFNRYAIAGAFTFSNANFGGDPIFGVAKSGLAKPFLKSVTEGNSATFAGPVEVAYGANGSYAYNWGTSGTVTFTNAAFGGDPAPNTAKTGYFMPYTPCADENGTLTFSTPTDLAYGANGHYSFLHAFTGTVTFNNATFGDPISGAVKSGYSRPSH
ncbi:MAG: phosphatidylinositol-specific phospholipase C [Capsulimonas sp.]|uniref:phosphatidylinositol-specific phospholipase C n=1 Tax=Capsulimonas sp. TaxID=2494211 RepID=UPI003262D6CA